MAKDKKDKHKKDTDKKRKRDKDDEARQAEKARKLVQNCIFKQKAHSEYSGAAKEQPRTT
jgi:hypothetical protein